MIKLFFITFFIAELVIAFAIISKIISFDKYVNSLNNTVLEIQPELSMLFMDIRVLLREINRILAQIKQTIKQKKEEYLIKIIKTTAIYVSCFSLKGKYKKALIAYQLGKEIYEALKESS